MSKIKVKPVTLESLTKAELLDLIRNSGVGFSISPVQIYHVRMETLRRKAKGLLDQAIHERANVIPKIKDVNKRTIARAQAYLKEDRAFRLYDRLDALGKMAMQEFENRKRDKA